MAKRRKKRLNATKLDILQVANKMFLEKGFTKTSAQAISEELEISTGNLTYHFPSKEDILVVLVEMFCKFSWDLLQREIDDGKSSLLALCMELTAMAAMADESEIAKDFYLALYSHPSTLEIAIKNDKERAKSVMKEYTEGWTEEQFRMTQTMVSGIEYTTLMTTERALSLEQRIKGALNGVMMLYGIPEEVRVMKIEKILAMDYRAIGRKMLHEFIEYVENATEEQLYDVVEKSKKDIAEAKETLYGAEESDE